MAVWRQALTSAQIAALHALGNEYGYDVGVVDLLFDAPRDYPMRVGARDGYPEQVRA